MSTVIKGMEGAGIPEPGLTDYISLFFIPFIPFIPVKSRRLHRNCIYWISGLGPG
jgi:hypothetical protein